VKEETVIFEKEVSGAGESFVAVAEAALDATAVSACDASTFVFPWPVSDGHSKVNMRTAAVANLDTQIRPRVPRPVLAAVLPFGSFDFLGLGIV